MKPRTLRGFRDYLPTEMLAKDAMLGKVRDVFEAFGYPPFQTPALEYSELLAGKYGEEGEMLMYRFRDHGDRDICLRYDLTVPLARVVAQHTQLTLPFRRYQIAPVWRAEKPARGRYREFLQCDVDLVGINDVAADAEMLLINAAVLEALEIEEFEVRINHRGVLRALTRSFGIAPGPPEAAFLRLLDKLPKIGEERFRSALEKDFAFDASSIDAFLVCVRPQANSRETLDRIRDRVGEAEGLERLHRILDLIEASRDASYVTVDPRIARGLAYYDGLINETFLSRLPEVGSVMSGGRYDGLVGDLCGRDLPAVGNSLGVDRLFDALSTLRPTTPAASPAQVMVIRFDEEGATATFAIASRLRAAGIRTCMYPTPAKLKKQFQYANNLGIPYVVLQGESEAARGVVTVKDMERGEQEELALDEWIARRVAAGSAP